jgi:hypothetical protein
LNEKRVHTAFEVAHTMPLAAGIARLAFDFSANGFLRRANAARLIWTIND